MTIFDQPDDAVVSSHLSYQASAEQRAKESTQPDMRHVIDDPVYRDELYHRAATTVANIPGVTFGSFTEYLDRVDEFLKKVQANRS